MALVNNSRICQLCGIKYIVDAFMEALEDAGIEKKDLGAAWSAHVMMKSAPESRLLLLVGL